MKSAFHDIVSDELKKIKDSSMSDSLGRSNSVPEASDELWEYNGLQDAYQGECEEILLELQRVFYEDLRREPEGKEPKQGIETWKVEQDEYLASAVYEHMQLNEQVQ
ncbi:Chaperone DnaJ-domain superfamily protein, putative isoform 1 [Hibiscus syriacus]|uniref:Chaperone DnaJ-domain superfamily protein, putative isoform 1 n=1 Tax=Hibiscus syriacus TaxID=106335 RepID=A0A6A2Z1E9_HIBSY|nr:Chaperone DnaJ-domain superfamily protein, putative isoform 1 [Hibiscus syriacus]